MSTNEPAPPDTRPTLAEQVHRNILAELSRAGKKRVDLQRQLEVAPMYMQRRYSGIVEWGWEDIEKIAAWLKVPEQILTSRPK